MRFSLVIILCLVLSGSIAQKKNYAKEINAAKDSVQRLMKANSIPGLSITVTVNGATVWAEGFGYADLEQKVRIDPGKTKFRIGSISKSLTAAGLGRLYEQGKIQLDSSIYYYLPDYPKLKYRPTLRQVAGHIAGIRHYRGSEFMISEHYLSVTDALKIFNSDSLLFKPGTKYQYSSYGFNLLSAVMEKASGKGFLNLMKESVFMPLQMNNTMPDLIDSLIDSRTRFYMISEKHLRNAPFVDNSYKWAGGGFISTSNDLSVFGNALLKNTFLKEETVSLLTTSQKLTDGKPTEYGIGFGSENDKAGRKYFGHSGGSVGGTSDMVIYPNEKVVVVILTNLSSARLGDLSNRVARLFMN